MQVKISVNNGKIPYKATTQSACYDVYSSKEVIVPSRKTVIVPTGFSVAIPDGYKMVIVGRSGLSSKGYFVITGTIDSDYRGEVGVLFYNSTDTPYKINKGDRIGQCEIAPITPIEFVECKTLPSASERKGGFGSTGK